MSTTNRTVKVHTSGGSDAFTYTSSTHRPTSACSAAAVPSWPWSSHSCSSAPSIRNACGVASPPPSMCCTSAACASLHFSTCSGTESAERGNDVRSGGDSTRRRRQKSGMRRCSGCDSSEKMAARTSAASHFAPSGTRERRQAATLGCDAAATQPQKMAALNSSWSTSAGIAALSSRHTALAEKVTPVGLSTSSSSESAASTLRDDDSPSSSSQSWSSRHDSTSCAACTTASTRSGATVLAPVSHPACARR